MTDKKSALATRCPGERSCPRCGAAFVCGMAAGEACCWCAELPPVLSLPDAASGCYCPDCLREIIGQAIRDRGGVAGIEGKDVIAEDGESAIGG